MTTGPDSPTQKGLPNLPKTKAVSSSQPSFSTETYIVKPSESLVQIAEFLGITPFELAAANNLKEQSLIFPGQRLTIPQSTGGTLETKPVSEHVVQRNESLNSITEKYGLSVSELQIINNLPDECIIFPGTRLKLQAEEKPRNSPPTLQLTKRFPKHCLVHGYHRVRAGDQLSRIASLHGVSTQALLNANQFGWNTVIREGQKLIVPIAHTVMTCPNLVELSPVARGNAKSYRSIASKMNASDFIVVVALCLEMQRSGLMPQFGAVQSGEELIVKLMLVEGIETMSVSDALKSSEFSGLAEGAALWEPSAWVWLKNVEGDF